MTKNRRNPYTYVGMTVSICPTCHRSLPAALQERENRVYLSKSCPEHGRFKSIVSSDAAYTRRALSQPVPSLMMRRHQTETVHGCPHDCGVCPEHQQNNALPAIEITDYCNIDCPICFSHNLNRYMMSEEELARCLDTLEASGSEVDALVLLGGEPTAHPRLIELIKQCYERPFIHRVAIATNGVLLRSREKLVQQLAETNTYVLLQLDSVDPAKNQVLRGEEMTKYREGALAALEKHQVHTTILMTVIKGLNDDEIGNLFRYALSKPFIGGFEVQTMCYTGIGGSNVPFDPMDRVTGTDLVRNICEQAPEVVRPEEFMPMPHPHPQCVAVTYVLRLGDGSFVPLSRFVDHDLLRASMLNQFVARPDARHEEMLREAVDRLWTNRHRVERSELILDALKSLLLEMYPSGRVISDAQRMQVAEKYVKNVFLHNYMDDHTFDAGVLRQCASMQVLPDGRMVPQCGWRVLHRYSDPRWRDRKPSLGHGLDGLRATLE